MVTSPARMRTRATYTATKFRLKPVWKNSIGPPDHFRLSFLKLRTCSIDDDYFRCVVATIKEVYASIYRIVIRGYGDDENIANVLRIKGLMGCYAI